MIYNVYYVRKVKLYNNILVIKADVFSSPILSCTIIIGSESSRKKCQ